jgi:hypothetical protein
MQATYLGCGEHAALIAETDATAARRKEFSRKRFM